MPGITSTDNTYYEDPEPYYKTQYRILDGPRSDAPGHQEAEPRERARIQRDGRRSGRRAVPDQLQAARLGARCARRPRRAEAPKIDETPDESALVSAFIGHVTVIPVTGSRLVDITFTALDPKFAALAVNTLVDEYVEQNLAVKLQGTQNMIDWLEQEVTKQQAKVQESERGLADYRDRQNAMSLDDKQNIVLSRLNKLNDDVMMARRRRRRRKKSSTTRSESIAAGQSPETIPAVAQSADGRRRPRARVIDAQRTRAALAERYGEKHPNLVRRRAATFRRRSGSTSSKSAAPFSRSRTTTTRPCSKSRRWRGRSTRRRPTRRI